MCKVGGSINIQNKLSCKMCIVRWNRVISQSVYALVFIGLTIIITHINTQAHTKKVDYHIHGERICFPRFGSFATTVIRFSANGMVCSYGLH